MANNSISNENNNNKAINNNKKEKSSTKNVDPNIDVDKNQENEEISFEENIDHGETKKYETKKKDNTSKIKKNINMFFPNKDDIFDKPAHNIDNEDDKKKFTNEGNIISSLSKKEKMVKNEKITVSPSPDGNTDNKDNNAPHSKDNKIYDVLGVSSANLDLEFLKEEVAKKRDEGYFPLFLRIDNDKHKFFFIKNDSTLRCLIKTYKMMMGIDDLKIKYILYNDKNKILDQDIEIKYLKIDPLSVISNHPK